MRLFLATALVAVATLYAFIVLVDPWSALPLSLPFDRGPVDGNARYAFPALARDARFDAALFGTSTSRLIRPTLLDRALGTRSANLAMNSATALEQSRLLRLFLAHHPRPKLVAIGLDGEWCMDAGSYRPKSVWPFPDWLYDAGPWRGYREMFDFYALERAGQAFAEWTGLKPRVYGRDGYTRFVPDESRYDLAKVKANVAPATPWGPTDRLGPDPRAWSLPGLDLLRDDLAAIPPDTPVLLWFVPYAAKVQPSPEMQGAWLLDECKARVTALASARPNVTVADFMIESPVTRDIANYWDTQHTRQPVADHIAADLLDALRGVATDDDRLLVSPRK